jgi:hypothetical protein
MIILKLNVKKIVWAQFMSLAQDRNAYEHPVTVEVGEFVEWHLKKNFFLLS